MSAPAAIVLGAGPSGLAVAACLQQRGVEALVLEARDSVGSSWRRHYKRLHLHTVKQHSALPGMSFGDTVSTYPSREEVIAYLDAYARRFRIVPKFQQDVRGARREHGRWVVETAASLYEAQSLVVATGYNRVPRVPSWPGQGAFAGEVMHASRYSDGARFRGRRALVVGVGNTGAEIALDLWEHGAEVTLCARSPQHIVPRDVLGIPAQVNSLLFFRHLPLRLGDALAAGLSRVIYGDLSRYGLRSPATGMLTNVVTRGHIPLLDIGTVELIRQGAIKVVPGVREMTHDEVLFVDGHRGAFELVVLATGYHPGIDEFLSVAAEVTDDRGYPRAHGAAIAAHPGLYFVGYRNPLTGALHDIAREAERVARIIAGQG